ncbi:LAFE_0C04786g1_1 [Lachancea fermentati]|uniref:LAFE_0C04786g1_1 n=1 Tax=Lachancea fermentati TaxID=4955 RepID=A0A1G4M9T1_LACFM|nr:LAFE_0C04786g1_1 [Lachancea fermentati]
MSTARVAKTAQLGSQRDYNHATDPEYKRLRDAAEQAYSKRQQFSQQSQQAYKSGDGAAARELSEKAKQQLEVAEKFNLQAAEYVFTQNNADSDSNEIDLHGLYTKEAQWILQRRIAAAVANRESVLKVIVGKGLHSANGVAKIKPAVEELCSEAHLANYIDPKNAGVLVVELQGASVPASWATTEYSSYAHGGVAKPPSAHQAQNQPQHPNYQQQPHYQQQQQPQYQQQQPQYQQPATSNGNQDIVSAVLNFLCMCVRKNF